MTTDDDPYAQYADLYNDDDEDEGDSSEPRRRTAVALDAPQSIADPVLGIAPDRVPCARSRSGAGAP